MDPITVLQSRVEQLEAKLGLAAGAPLPGAHAGIVPNQEYQGDCAVPGNQSVTSNLLQAAETIQNATAGHEKLNQAMNMASELNNYTDPNHMQNQMQQNQMHMQELASQEAAVRQYCQCMQHCNLATPVLDSQSIQQVPQMQAQVDQMHAAAAEAKAQADQVSHGVQELAQTCGSAANEASEQIADIAQKVEQVEEKKFPKRRNGLD